MLVRRQTIFSTHYFQFVKRSAFIFVYVMNVRNDLLCLPSWHRGKQRKLSWKNRGIKLSDSEMSVFELQTSQPAAIEGAH